MNLEKQVCSLELAKKLEELVVGQESLFVWWYTETMATELGDMFPENYKLTLSKYGEMLQVNLLELDKQWGKERNVKNLQAESESDARTKMLIYILENKLVKIEDINK